MPAKKLHCFLMIFILIGIIFVCGCEMIKKSDASKELTIKDIAFDTNKKYGYTVYIEEGSGFAPYLVLTSDYNGHTLLLRKELLNEAYIFDEDSGYYRDSSIDIFLNNDFIAILDPSIQNAIVDTDITITAESNSSSIETNTEIIPRKVFLLSYTEVGLSGSELANEEGRALKYFEGMDSRIAYLDKEASSWWLRTSYTWYDNTAWGISPEGGGGGGGVNYENGVRPAFCLENTVLIEESDKVIEGKTVYVIGK